MILTLLDQNLLAIIAKNGFPYIATGATTGSQYVANKAFNKLTLAVATYNPGGCFADARFTAKMPGTYKVDLVGMTFGGNHGGQSVVKNGTTAVLGTDDRFGGVLSGTVPLLAGEYLEFYASAYATNSYFSIGSFTINRIGL